MSRIASGRGWLCAGVLAPGLCLALIQWPASVIVVTFMLATFLAGITIILLRSAQSQSNDWFATEGWGPVTTTAVLIGTAAVSLAATSEVSPALAILMVLTMALCSPWGLRLLRLLMPTQPEPPTPLTSRADSDSPPVTRARAVDGSALRDLTNAELCTAWRVSYLALQRAGTTHERARLVAIRQIYLDEMETRNPTALTAWLASGARAASGPDRFLHDGPESRH